VRLELFSSPAALVVRCAVYLPGELLILLNFLHDRPLVDSLSLLHLGPVCHLHGGQPLSELPLEVLQLLFLDAKLRLLPVQLSLVPLADVLHVVLKINLAHPHIIFVVANELFVLLREGLDLPGHFFEERPRHQDLIRPWQASRRGTTSETSAPGGRSRVLSTL